MDRDDIGVDQFCHLAGFADELAFEGGELKFEIGHQRPDPAVGACADARRKALFHHDLAVEAVARDIGDPEPALLKAGSDQELPVQ